MSSKVEKKLSELLVITSYFQIFWKRSPKCKALFQFLSVPDISMDSNTFSLPKRKSPWQRFGASHDLFSVVTVSTFSCLNSDTFADLFVSWWYGIWIPNFESRLKLHRLGWSDHFVVIKRWQHYKTVATLQNGNNFGMLVVHSSFTFTFSQVGHFEQT